MGDRRFPTTPEVVRNRHLLDNYHDIFNGSIGGMKPPSATWLPTTPSAGNRQLQADYRGSPTRHRRPETSNGRQLPHRRPEAFNGRQLPQSTACGVQQQATPHQQSEAHNGRQLPHGRHMVSNCHKVFNYPIGSMKPTTADTTPSKHEASICRTTTSRSPHQ